MNSITVTARTGGRSAYRVVPDPDDPVILQLDGHLTRVLDLSAAGFSCPPDVVQPGRRYPYSMDLPTAKVPLKGYVDALPETHNGQLHCKFVELSVDELDTLHHYVLVRQKEAIRALREGRSRYNR